MTIETPPAAVTPMAEPLGGAPPEGFDPVAMSRETLRRGLTATLATLDPGSGYPLATLVNLATDVDGAPILLASKLSLHTRNIAADPRVSILVTTFGRGDPLAASARVSLVGRAEPCPEPRVRRRFLARHPKAEFYVDFPDFAFFRLAVEAVHLNGGFARAAAVAPADLLLAEAGVLGDGEEGAVAHMNSDHADAVALYATRLCGRQEGAWRMTGIDPEGADLVCGRDTARLVFPAPIREAGALRRVLVDLARTAREKSVAVP